MGFRQGETLGLRWSYVDLHAELFHPQWQLQRLTWRHGCDDPHTYGRRLHRFEPCPPDCTRMRTAAGELWEEHDVVFSRPDGRPLDPRADYEEFKDLLAEAGIDDRRLYDGSCHTAGTILNELGVDMPTIMEILRRTQISQTRRYVKGRSQLSKDAMRRMGEFFVAGPQLTPDIPATRDETTDSKAARSRRRRRIC